MYNYSFQKTEQDYVYLAFDVDLDKTEEAVSALKALGCKGVNVTMPCKTKVAELADELSDAAELIGACNTVVVKDGKLHGHNTDGIGFVQSAASSSRAAWRYGRYLIQSLLRAL